MPPQQDSTAHLDPSLSVRATGNLSSLAIFLAPLLICLALLTTAWFFPAYFATNTGQPLSTRFLPTTTVQDPHDALGLILQRPTQLSSRAAEGPVWLLADLAPKERPGSPTALLLSANQSLAPGCWRFDSQNPRLLTEQDFQPSVLGYAASVPGSAKADQILCRLDLAFPGTLAVEQWDPQALALSQSHATRTLGLLEGGLLMLAAFLGVIALTTREQLYIVLTCWILCNLRLGAWALNWDHLWLGHLLSPDNLVWSRKLTLPLSFTTTWMLFTCLFRQSLGPRILGRLRIIGLTGSVLLLAPIFLPSYDMFQTASFLAAWLGTALVATILIHALFRSTTRALFWHTIGVCFAVGVLLAGLILIGLDHRSLISGWPGTVIFLGCNLLIALATANRIRENRQIDLRQRNELIAHDSLSPLGMFTLGATRHFEHLNPNARGMLLISDGPDTPSLNWKDFFPDVDWAAVSLATEQGRDTEIQLLPSPLQPTTRSFLLRATLVGSRIEGSLQDVGARSETLRNLRLTTDHDPLTNTLNRHGIEDATQSSIDDLQQSGTPCALAYLSLDHLKRVNDLFGHSAGDQLLQLACDRLKYALTEQQQLGRIGSDEFIILFPRVRAREARRIGQDIVETLNATPFHVSNRSFQIKSAMGLIDLDARMRPKDAIAAASRACRDARKQHQDIVLYEENAHELFDHINELRVFEQLEQGTSPEDIHLEMQPIMSLRHPLQTLNFEALLRVHSHGDHPLQTYKIIQAAEDTGMITMIDKWVFSTTLDWMAQNDRKLGRTQQVNVNLSGVSLNDDHFIDTLFGILNQQPQFTRRLCVEITEGVALQDLERTRQFMRRLQRMGARVALDDFGAGYTSFSYLKELPADTIKIDGTLIRDMLGSEANIAIVNSIVDLAHNLGMECIAEWVEDVATLRTLAEMGVDYVQGFVISAARQPAEILAHDNILPLIANPAARAYVEEISGRSLPA